MKSLQRLFILSVTLLFIASCSSTESITEIDSVPEAETEEITATETWHLTPANENPYLGTGVEKAYRELLADKDPKEKVIVAIIDSGTDIYHEDLNAKIWTNEDEIRNNNLDDDQNGYVDDIYGWNFIGGPDSTHVNKDTYELTRIYARLSEKYKGVARDSSVVTDKEEFDYYLEIREDFNDRIQENRQEMMQLDQTRQAIQFALTTLGVSSIDSLSVEQLEVKNQDTQQVMQAKQILNYLKGNGATDKDLKDLEEYYDHVNSLAEYELNPDFNPRPIVGDDYDDLSNRYYGNNDVVGPRNDHGTHVAGIVGAIRDNNLGAQGIADNIELMILRTVPDGDERDKDVANSIRYAAENGAKVINMSFGKGYSPYKHYVDDAIRFADSLGVLMVTGAGNDGKNIDSTSTYPSPEFNDGSRAVNYLTVGASSWKTDSTLTAGFSNYGKSRVDLFAPGVDIYSTYPDNEYQSNSGTSMASPVVAGVAALIMSHYPELSTREVKEIILETVTKVDKLVVKPGSGELVNFSNLSSTGGIINAYKALKIAEERANQ
jgi:subtilisin family serine protease